MGGAPRKMLEKINDDVEFRQHQVDGVRELLKIGSALLCDEMGLGKSLQALTMAAVEHQQGNVKRVLIVCPPGLKPNWVDEIRKFTTFTHTVLDGAPKKRENTLDAFDTDILIVNYEQVIPHLSRLNKMGFGMVIYDEAHYMKSHKSKRTRACLKLKAERQLLLTGSPLLNRVNELWTLLHRVRPHEFPSYWTFVHRYVIFGGYQDKEIVGTKNQAELRAHLQTVMVRRLKKDVLDLPEKNRITIRVDMLPEQKKLYKEAKDTLQLQLPGQPDPMQLESGMTRFLRLKQICSTTGNLIPEDFSAKLDVAIERANEVIENGMPVVLWTQFRPTNACAARRCQEAGLPVWVITGDTPTQERQQVVRHWSSEAADGRPGALVCMLQVAGVGLNMTAADTCIFVDKLFVPKLNEQAEDRIHRIGASTTKPVTIIDIVVNKSIESRVERILERKKKLNDEIVETDDLKRAIYQAMMEEDDE